MWMTGKQAYVLAHLDRVTLLPYKLKVNHQLHRYQLDGWECTAQITGLVIRKLIVEHPTGVVERLIPCCSKVTLYRQPPSPETLAALRAACLDPVSIHREKRLRMTHTPTADRTLRPAMSQLQRSF